MKKDIIIVILLIACIVTLIISNYGGSYESKIYDCNLSEISPDYPVEVKQECRKLRYEQYKREQDEIQQKRLINT